MSAYDFDLLTIGAGSGGVAASRRAGSHGAKVAICEARGLGGTCVLRGCVPKKLLMYASALREELACARGFGWHVDGTLDWAALIAAKQAELRRLEGVYERLLLEAGVTVLRGHATLVDPHTVEIGGARHTAARILVATGGRPSLPSILGVELGMTSDDALDRTDVPGHITIIGTGYIGVEFAGIYHGAGAEVALVGRCDGLLRGFDEDVRKHLDDELCRRGIDIRRRNVPLGVERIGERLRVQLRDGAALMTDAVLFATGRVPNTEGLGLEACGVALDADRAIDVDEHSRTNVPSIWAIGDVTSRPQLTPMAIADGRAFADSELGGRPRTNAHEHVATAVFSQPPCGTVGLTEAEARARGEVLVYRIRFTPMKHAFAGHPSVTMMKLVVDRETDRVLGVHIVGHDAPEILQGFAVAVRCGATKAQLDATLAIHPTAAEELVTMMTPVG